MNKFQNTDYESDDDIFDLPLSERSKRERKVHSKKNHVILFLCGLFVGICVICLIGHPFKSESYDEANYKKVSMENEKLKKEKQELEENLEKLEKKADEDKKIINDAGKDLYARNNLIKSAYEFYENNNKTEAKKLLKDFTKSNFDFSEGKQLFVALGGKNEEKTVGRRANDLFVKGRQQYNWGHYDKALKKLLEADALDRNDQSIMYFIGRCYEKKNDLEKAKYYYEKVVLIDDNSDRGILANQRLEELSAQ